MNKARGYHTCLLKPLPSENDMLIVVAGGGHESIEIFSIKNRTWIYGQKLCENQVCFRFVGSQGITTAQSTFMIGGLDLTTQEYSKAVFELKCPSSTSCGN
jgi:hypothetical protein